MSKVRESKRKLNIGKNPFEMMHKYVKKVIYTEENWFYVSSTVLNLDSQKDILNVLDVGCGAGKQLADFRKLGHECTGVDIDKNVVREANQINGKRCEFIVTDACHLPFVEGYFDIVYSNEFLSHVTDVAQALSEQKRLLKKGGQLMVRDGNFLSPTLFDLLVLYPIRRKGRYGGLKWMLNYDKVINNIYGSGVKGKDENIKTLNWWRATIMNQKDLKLKIATNSFVQRHPKNWVVRLLKQFLGQVVIVAEKCSQNKP